MSSSESGKKGGKRAGLSLFVRKGALFFSTDHGAFLFGKAKRKGGWEPFPTHKGGPAPEGETSPGMEGKAECRPPAGRRGPRLG